MNKAQKVIISIIVPVLIILIGFMVIGYDGSTSSNYEGGLAFNPIKYFSKNGIEWAITVFLVGMFEFFWWKSLKLKSE